jgi:hypothetical protein
MSLILHCGANYMDRAEINMLPTPLPQGPQHHPVAHGDFIDMVESACEDAGLFITEEAFGATADGNRFFGVVSLQGKGLAYAEDYTTCLGLRGSHDMSLGRGLAGGARVSVCDNLSLFGEWSLSTKHTTNIMDRLPAMIHNIVGHMGDASERQAAQFESYKECMLTSRQADAAMLDLLRRRVVNSQQLPRLIHEWDEPSHEEFEESGPSVWRLFNGVTEVLKPRTPESNSTLPTLGPKTIALHAKCDELALAA